MKKNYIDITKRISGDLQKLRQDIPDTMKAFSALAQAAGRDGALDRKTKELIALAIAIATRCDGCIGFHNGSAGQARGHPSGGGGNPRHDHLYGWRAVADVRGGRHLSL